MAGMDSRGMDERARLVTGGVLEGEEGFELKLRPQRLGEFIGQPKVKENLAVAITAARAGRVAVLGIGGPPSGHHDRPGAVGAHPFHRYSGFHLYWRDDAHRAD